MNNRKLRVQSVNERKIASSQGAAHQSAASRRGAPGALSATGLKKLRVFASPRRNGKPSALNIGLQMARGEFVAIVDADSELQFGSIQHWLIPFDEARVGAVAANLRVRNAGENVVTRLQECEYAG